MLCLRLKLVAVLLTFNSSSTLFDAVQLLCLKAEENLTVRL